MIRERRKGEVKRGRKETRREGGGRKKRKKEEMWTGPVSVKQYGYLFKR